MPPKSVALLSIGGLLFLTGAVLLHVWMGGGPSWLLPVGLGVIAVSALSLAAGGFLVGARPDPLELRRQRRLWRSGPLGRWWLDRRNRLP